MATRREYRFEDGTITLVEDAPFADVFIRLKGSDSTPVVHLSANAAADHAKIYSLTGSSPDSPAYGKGLRTLAVDLYLQYLREMGLPPETEILGTVEGGTAEELRHQLAFWKRFGFKIKPRPGLAPQILARLGRLRLVDRPALDGQLQSLLPLTALEPCAN